VNKKHVQYAKQRRNALKNSSNNKVAVMNRKSPKCDHIGILTNNSKRLIDFYTKKMGFAKNKENRLPKSIIKTIFDIPYDCKFIKLVSGDMMIEIFEPLSAHVHERMNNIVGMNHWGYCVEDREKFVQELNRREVDITRIKRNEHIIYFVTDPDGNRIEIRDDKKKTSKS